MPALRGKGSVGKEVVRIGAHRHPAAAWALMMAGGPPRASIMLAGSAQAVILDEGIDVHEAVFGGLQLGTSHILRAVNDLTL